jgi:ribosome maturation factor RimP
MGFIAGAQGIPFAHALSQSKFKLDRGTTAEVSLYAPKACCAAKKRGTKPCNRLKILYNQIHIDQTGGIKRPFFFGRSTLLVVVRLLFLLLILTVSLQTIVETTVSGLGYDLVEIDRSAGGLLRITIDHPWLPGASEALVAVEDCERVTRQLQFALEVEEIDYRRLEVSSPGIDRPLRHQADFERFAGQMIDVTLKAPMGAAASGQVSANRKKFRGMLEKTPAGGWQIVWSDAPEPKPGVRVSKKKAPAAMQALGFSLDELREARLAPIVDFKGRKPKAV